MGTWGTGISSNDTYSDIYGEFIDLYNDGNSVIEITKKLIANNQETINSREKSSNFWFAIANGQWECNELDKEIFSKVEEIIESKMDIEIWSELGSTQSDLKKREQILLKFLEKIKTEKGKPRKRTKKKLYDSIFSKGDCLVYKMDNGNYGGAFVLTDEKSTEVGANEIAITSIDKATKPTLEDFKNGQVYITHSNEVSVKNNQIQENLEDRPHIGGFSAISFNRDKPEIEVIGQLQIYNEYDSKKLGESAYPWSALFSIVASKEKYIEVNGQPKSKVSLNNWTKKSWIKNWL